ncbi:MAG: sulfite exporter TauE/SafE family protein [Hyphomicrobiaceae bacterium]|nr:sulfite exporter TauE/SafE family protein [Hyphomicrobiaceae bacterium]
MATSLVSAALAVSSGGAIGLVLGLVGSGGSILAVPLLIYVVGVSSPHIAIGTAAAAVGLSAVLGVVGHAKRGMVKWNCALVFTLAGVLGSALGAAAGKAMDGQRLLALFGVAMVAVGVSMLRGKSDGGDPTVQLTRLTARTLAPWLLAAGFGVGLLSGFFGIGGGFLIVPALMFATGMPIAHAVGTSLVAVTAFGLTTAGSYAASGLIDWPLVALLVSGGAIGMLAAGQLGQRLATRKGLLTTIFATAVVIVGAALTSSSFVLRT